MGSRRFKVGDAYEGHRDIWFNEIADDFDNFTVDENFIRGHLCYYRGYPRLKSSVDSINKGSDTWRVGIR